MDISDTTKLVQTADALVGLYDVEKRAREAAEARIAELERERTEALNQLDKIAAALGMQDTDDDMAEEIAKHTRERAELEAKLAEAHGTVKALRDAMLVEHGCYPLDEVTPAQKIVVAAMRRADAVLETSGTEAAAAVLEAAAEWAKAEESGTDQQIERAMANLRNRARDWSYVLAKRGRT